MEIKKPYIILENLEVYKLSRELSKIGWDIYEPMDWQTKKVSGDQFITATDSAGANITEGYGRFHFLDKIKFFYNARASLMEANDYWIELLLERNKVDKQKYQEYKNTAKILMIKLNNLISATYKAKEKA